LMLRIGLGLVVPETGMNCMVAVVGRMRISRRIAETLVSPCISPTFFIG
jgi:hypothetical protein